MLLLTLAYLRKVILKNGITSSDHSPFLLSGFPTLNPNFQNSSRRSRCSQSHDSSDPHPYSRGSRLQEPSSIRSHRSRLSSVPSPVNPFSHRPSAVAGLPIVRLLPHTPSRILLDFGNMCCRVTFFKQLSLLVRVNPVRVRVLCRVLPVMLALIRILRCDMKQPSHMEAQPSRKRPNSGEDDDDDEFNKKPQQKRVRFPKGKKVRFGDAVVVNAPEVAEDDPEGLNDSQVVAKARSKRRNQNRVGLEIEATGDLLDNVAASEMHYEDNEQLEDDGIQLEPFNLEQERREGYFDQTGNYVEYVSNDFKDAWLDSIDADPNLAQRHTVITDSVVEAVDLTSQDIGRIKRRIADVLEPGETVLQALRRLKGGSNSRKEKMSAETKLVFDQLTEDASKLMEDGDYNVYDEKQEVFQREAEGFEKLARARGEGTSSSSANMQSDSSVTSDFNLNGKHAADNTSNNDDGFDMFADGDGEKAIVDPSNGTGPTQNDYVFDESSGYYYSSSLGYYYDPSSGLYCNAASGQWYSYNEETRAYDELQAEAAATVGEADTS
ncbi:hypothetical protein R6Q57_019372 [Mikania cordata]